PPQRTETRLTCPTSYAETAAQSQPTKQSVAVRLDRRKTYRPDEAIHSSFVLRHGLLRFARNTEDARSRSRGAMHPSFARSFLNPLQTEGAGNAGCALHPRSHVQW